MSERKQYKDYSKLVMPPNQKIVFSKTNKPSIWTRIFGSSEKQKTQAELDQEAIDRTPYWREPKVNKDDITMFRHVNWYADNPTGYDIKDK